MSRWCNETYPPLFLLFRVVGFDCVWGGGYVRGERYRPASVIFLCSRLVQRAQPPLIQQLYIVGIDCMSATAAGFFFSWSSLFLALLFNRLDPTACPGLPSYCFHTQQSFQAPKHLILPLPSPPLLSTHLSNVYNPKNNFDYLCGLDTYIMWLDPYPWEIAVFYMCAGTTVGVGMMDGAPMPLVLWRTRSLFLSLSMVGVTESNMYCRYSLLHIGLLQWE